MKIKRNNINKTKFENISVGTVFRYLDDAEDNSLYMRIKDVKVKVEDDYNDTINAIALDDGEAVCFLDFNTVVVVDGEFVTNE
jgi:hypothetical protein